LVPHQDALTCEGEIIKNKYLVRYKNGETRAYVYNDRSRFRDEVVAPSLDEIAYIEFDQRFELEKRTLAPAALQTIDNWGLERINALLAPV
jgi:hypothetical protein